jgi:hypothetical protein
MNKTQIEVVGKVFVVVGDNRKCLICEGMFTPAQAANHATVPCHPTATHLRHTCGIALDFLC